MQVLVVQYANTLGRANIATQQAVTTESQSSSKPKDDSHQMFILTSIKR